MRRGAANRHRLVALAISSTLLLGAGLAGCAQTFDARGLGVPATLASPAGPPPAGTRFSVTSRALFGLWGAVRLREPSLRKALAAQLADGRGIADVRIRVRSRWSDVLVTGLTLGLVVPRSVTFEGVVTPAGGSAQAP